ncbi:MAG: hypothetical protein EOR56_34610, partial [Mesorhizobium sp.]
MLRVSSSKLSPLLTNGFAPLGERDTRQTSNDDYERPRNTHVALQSEVNDHPKRDRTGLTDGLRTNGRATTTLCNFRDRVMAVNLRGSFNAARAALVPMKAQ